MGGFRYGGEKILSTSSLLSVHEKLVKTFKDIFNEQVDSSDSLAYADGLDIIGSIGYFRGCVNSNKIVLPIETDVVLQESNNVLFNPQVPQEVLNTLYTRVFTSRSQQFELKPLPECVEVIENNPEAFHNVLYKSQLNLDDQPGFNWTKSIQRLLTTCSVYRPNNYHYQINVFKHEFLNENIENINCDTCTVKVYRPYGYKVSKGFGPSWKLSVVQIFENVENEDILHLFCNSEDRKEEDEERKPNFLIELAQNFTNYHSIEFYLDSLILLKQWKRLQSELINRFSDLIWMYERNIISLSNILSSAHTEVLENGVDSIDFYPFLFGDHVQEIRFHYDTKRNVKQKFSTIESLRKHNNIVKRGLIYVFVKKNSRVLDLACGRGQDLDKYSSVGINFLVGIDVSSREIQEARRRFNQRSNFFPFVAEFHHGNLIDSKTFTSFLSGKKFSVVSIQLAIHYIISTLDSLQTFLNNILAYMSEDAHFIGSTVSVERLVDGIVNEVNNNGYNKGNSLSFGNSIYKVTFSNDTMENIAAVVDFSSPPDLLRNQLLEHFNNTFNIPYTFSLIESIDAVEYVLPWSKIVNVALQMNLKLICDSTFDVYFDYLAEETKGGKPVYQSFQTHLDRLKNYALSNEEFEVFKLYKVFVFKRLSDVELSYLCGVSIKKPS